MPVRRTLLLLLAGLAVVPTPACLNFSGPVTTGDPPPSPSREFAILPSRPGEVVRTNPDAKANTAKSPTSPDSAGPSVGQVSNHRPDPASSGSGGTDPPLAVAQIKVEPAPLPLIGPPAPALEPPLLAAMRAFVENKPDKAIEYLKALDKPNQEFVLAMMPVLLRGSQINLAAPDPAEAAVLADQLQSVAAKLEAKAALKVERVAFCRKAVGFGLYEPWPEAQPYRPNDLAVLYVETRHLGSEPATGPHGEAYVTRAVISLEVRDANGRLVEQTDPADWRRRVPVARFDHADFTRTPLRDYSRVYRISVPAQPGVYTVTVDVRDPAGNRTARSQPAEFRVAGP